MDWETGRFDSSPPTATTVTSGSAICTHIHGLNRRFQIPMGRPVAGSMRKEETVYAPIARISNAIARYNIRQPRWIDEANAEHAAHVNEANAVIRIR